MREFLLDGGDASWVFAFDDIGQLLRKPDHFLFYNFFVFDDVDGDVAVNVS